MLIQRLFRRLHFRNVDRIAKEDIFRIIKKNNISVKDKIAGEDTFINKWNVFGREVDVRYYRVYATYIGKNENIVPANILKSIIEPILNEERYLPFYDDKNVYNKLLPKEYLPVTFLRRICGHYYDEDYNAIPTHKISLDYILQGLKEKDKFIIKPSTDSTSGKGILLFKKHQEESYRSHNGDLFSIDFINSFYKNDFIIQEYINQHHFTAQFNATSANTYRVSTYRSVISNKVHILGIVMRIGKKDAVVDNIHAGGYIVGVKSHGSLNNYLTNHYGHRISKWNDVDFKNSSFVTPHFNLIIDFAKQISLRILHARLLALDIIIDKNENPKLIEYNTGGFSDWLFELNTGSVFGDFTDEIISFCLERQNSIKYNFQY